MTATVSFQVGSRPTGTPSVCVVTGSNENLEQIPIVLEWQSRWALVLYFVFPFVSVFLPARRVELALPFSAQGFRLWLRGRRAGVLAFVLSVALLLVAAVMLSSSLVLASVVATFAVSLPVLSWLFFSRRTHIRITQVTEQWVTVSIPNAAAAEALRSRDSTPSPVSETIPLAVVHYQERAEEAPFGVILTRHHLWWLLPKMYRHTADYQYEPHLCADITEVAIEKRPASPLLWALSAAMVLAGGATSFWLYTAQMGAGPSVPLSGVPLALLVGGLFLPLVAGHRQTLVVNLRSGDSLRWEAPLVMGSARRKILETMRQVLAAAKEAGIPVRDALSGSPSAVSVGR